MKKIALFIAILFALYLQKGLLLDTWRQRADFGGIAKYGAFGFCNWKHCIYRDWI